MTKRIVIFLLIIVLLSGCTVSLRQTPSSSEATHTVPLPTVLPTTLPTFSQESTCPTTQPTLPSASTSPATQPTLPSASTSPADPAPLRIVIDAGHQRHGNYDREPIGPGAEETKAKVTSGTQGVSTGLAEYVLNLQVALKLQAELEARGYEVIQIRTTHDVDISNAQRAQIANDCGADAFLRIHANGSEDPAVNGIMTLCQTPDNPYNGWLYPQSRALAGCLLDAMVAATGAERKYVWETDTMSGINWCQVPAAIVEMGYMSNPAEDERMSTEEYQNLLVQGIANGLDAYFSQ